MPEVDAIRELAQLNQQRRSQHFVDQASRLLHGQQNHQRQQTFFYLGALAVAAGTALAAISGAEAALAGIPCVAARMGGLVDTVVDGRQVCYSRPKVAMILPQRLCLC